MDNRDLNTRIRSRLAQGLLPSGPGSKTYAGSAEGVICDCCCAPITGAELQYEVDFAGGSCGVRTRSLVMHRACHVVWVEESRTALGESVLAILESGEKGTGIPARELAS